MMKGVQYILIYVFLSLSLVSCYEKETACLDTYSNNFSITADAPCDECCTFPVVKIQFNYKLGETKYHKDSIIINDFGSEFKLERAVFFLSDFKFVKDDGDVLEVLDVANYERADGTSQELKEDHVVVESDAKLGNIGQVRETGLVESLDFQFGVGHNLIALESTTVLYQNDSLYLEDQFFDMVLYLKVGEEFEDRMVVKFLDVNPIPLSRNLLMPIMKSPRIDLGLSCTVDYLEFLQKIDINTIDKEIIITNFTIPESFINF